MIAGLANLYSDARISSRDGQILEARVNGVLSRAKFWLSSPSAVALTDSFLHIAVRAGNQPLRVLVSRTDSPELKTTVYRMGKVLSLQNTSGLPHVFHVDHNDPAHVVITNFQNSEPLEAALARGQNITRERIISILLDLATQVSDLHSNEVTHGDISSENILLDENFRTHLVDFEHAYRGHQRLQTVASTPGFTSPDIHRFIAEGYGGISFGRRAAWDRYALGKVLLRILTASAPEFFEVIDHFHQRAIHLIATRLLSGENSKRDELSLGLLPQDYKELSYDSVKEAVDDLKKLANPELVIESIPELAESFEDRIQASSIVRTNFTERLSRVIESPEFIRLKNVKQLALIEMVYETATHSRSEHSLGTYSVAAEYIRRLIRQRRNPLFLILVTPRHIRSVLLAALLHDIGHYPLAHDIEEVSYRLFSHEDRTNRLLDSLSEQMLSAITDPESDQGWEISISDIKEILNAEQPPRSSMMAGLLKSIISGTLDADKVDYLTRDGTRTNVVYPSGIDVRYLFETLTVVSEPVRHIEKGDPTHSYASVGVNQKGRFAAESIAFARYEMFGAAYWHHAYRSAKAMLGWSLVEAIRSVGFQRVAGLIDFWFEDQTQASGHVPIEYMKEPDVHVPTSTPAETAFLLRLGALGGGTVNAMCHALTRRALYKRGLIVVPYEDPSWPALEGLARFMRESVDGVQLGPYLVGKALQVSVTEILSAEPTPYSRTQVYRAGDLLSDFLQTGTKEQLFLVDFADSEPKRQTGQPYLAEQATQSNQCDPSEMLPLRPSVTLQKIRDFLTDLESLRILIHPRFVGYVIGMLGGEGLLECLLSVSLATLRGQLGVLSSDHSEVKSGRDASGTLFQ